MIGFKQIQEYTDLLKKHITSKYGNGLFLKTQSHDGTTYNITVEVSKIVDYELRLEEVVNLYQERLRWLNSDSRRLFGVIQERNICLVIDCKQKNPQEFSQFKNSVLNLLCDQVVRLNSFNIIRCMCDQSFEMFKPFAVKVSGESLEEAIEWLSNTCCCHLEINTKGCEKCIKNRQFTDTSTCEAVLIALQDQSLESVYLISEGVSSNGMREILYDKLVKESFLKRIRLNIISFNCSDLQTIEYLKRISQNSFGPGRFHAYCLLRKLEDYGPGPICSEPTKNNVTVNKLGFGGAPAGSGIKNDIMLIFEETQNAKDALTNLRLIIKSMNEQIANNYATANALKVPNKLPMRKRLGNNDEWMSSKDWLDIYGLTARKLDLFETLRGVCFKHCDGVVDVKQMPDFGRMESYGVGKQYYQGDAIPREKLVNARYCDQFAHVLWHDGTIVHVHVTPDLHRNYEKRVNISLEQYSKRIDWLNRGSRELFGTVVENNICILIDTSQSMQTSLEFVKQKLKILISEQLKAKTRFNLVSFNSRVNPWRDRMVEVDETSMQSALDWIDGLTAQGTTNTLGALRFALNDLNTEAIYLLSDGRPDQEPRQILSQISLSSKFPINTISFNCYDKEASGFLSELAGETKGRYHFFNENGGSRSDSDLEGLNSYQSEDLSLLKDEIKKGKQYLKQIAHLREECLRAASSGNSANIEIKSRNEIQKSDTYKYSDLKSANNGFQRKFNRNDSSSQVSDTGMYTLQDIQSLDWVLPETRMLLEKQFRNELNQSKKQSKFHNTCQPAPEKKRKPFKAKKIAKPIEPPLSPIKTDLDLGFSKLDAFLDEQPTERSVVNSPKNQLIEKIMNKTKDEKLMVRGCKVIARHDLLGYYFSGKVTRVIDSRTLNIKFDNDFKQNDMSCRNVIKTNESTGYLSIGDYVMASVINEYEDRCWVPGIIQTKLIQLDSRVQLFTVLYFNGQEGDNSRMELVKINKHIYGMAVNYIRSKLGLGTNVKESVINYEEKHSGRRHSSRESADRKSASPERSVSPEPEPRRPIKSSMHQKNNRSISPDLKELKSEILDEIKVYFDSLKLDERYQEMFAEFLRLRRNHKRLKEDLVDRMQTINTDFDDFKKKEPQVIIREKREKSKISKKPEQEIVEPLNRKTTVSVVTPRSHNSPNDSIRSQVIESTIELSYDHLVKGLRKKLSQLEIGEEVLAKWPDDGWYYRSIIIESLGDFQYRIEDSLNDTEIIYREDIISEKADAVKTLEVGDSVIGLHPYYEFSYAPGQVIQVSNDMEKIMVRFYDYVEAIVLRRDSFTLNHIKFQSDVELINRLEKDKVGKTVVARNTFSNVYELGKITKRVGNIGRQYVVEWSNGKQSLQNSNHIFGTDTRKPNIIVNDYVLAPKETIYLPGRVIDRQGDQLKVKFVDGLVDSNVYNDDCYWLSVDYYEDACSFYRRELETTDQLDLKNQLKMVLENQDDENLKKKNSRRNK